MRKFGEGSMMLAGDSWPGTFELAESVAKFTDKKPGNYTFNGEFKLNEAGEVIGLGEFRIRFLGSDNLPRIVPQQVWRPIETAPKDGTYIDLWVTCKVRGVREAYCRWENGGWVREELYSESAVDSDGWKATHWMPIPSGPVKE